MALQIPLILIATAFAQSMRDWQLLQGTWVIVKVETDGRKQTAAASELVVEKGGIGTRSKEGKIKLAFGFELNASRNPKAIDIGFGFGPCVSGAMPGVYALDRDELKVCFGQNKRPRRFATWQGSGFTLVEMKRKKQVRRPMKSAKCSSKVTAR